MVEPDLNIAFDFWVEKQPIYKKLPDDKSSKVTIAVDQLLLLMRESYKAGYKRAK